MSRRIFAALLATALSFVASASGAFAQTSPNSSFVVSERWSMSAPGAGPVLPLTGGQSNCSVVILNSTSFAGLTMVPQVASDGPNSPSQWVTVPLSTPGSAVGLTSLSSVGTYNGNVANYGITNFRVNITALSSGTVTFVESCSPAAIGYAPVSTYTPSSASNGANPGQSVISYGQSYNAATGNFDPTRVDPLHVLETTSGGTARYKLTSASTAGSCVSIGSGTGRLVKMWNTGPATTVYLTLYDEGSSPTCTASDSIFGDGTTIVVPAGGTMITFDALLYNGLAYKLSGALGATQNIHISTYGLGL